MIGLSVKQIEVWNLRKDGASYSAIKRSLPEIKHNHAIMVCLRRTALRLYWEPECDGGTDPYLSDEDTLKLVDYIRENAAVANTLATHEVIDAARSLKKERNHTAVQELIALKTRQLAQDICLEPEEPSRSWVNDFCCRTGLRVAPRTEIERTRLQASHIADLQSFITRIGPELQGVPPELLFNADETMLSGKRKYKGVVDVTEQVALAEVPKQAEHLTAMVTVSAVGARIPLFIILPGLVKLPDSLADFTSRCWFASSLNGWMTRFTFLDWCVNFCRWLSFYRASLPAHHAQSKAVLFLDGHTTRINPAAIDYFSRNRVSVIVLPPHTTHILQPFDVGIAATFKNTFKKNMCRALSETEQPTADELRHAAVRSAIDASDQATTFTRCGSSFRRTGIHPCDWRPLLSNPYVLPGQGDQNRPTRGLNIGGQVLTSPQTAAVVLQHALARRAPDDHTLYIVTPALEQAAMTRPVSDGRLLTSYHPQYGA